MKCDQCRADLEPGEARTLHGKQLCEDCYIDLLSPARPCDPWASQAAKSVSELAGDKEPITENQQRLLDILQSEKLTVADLAQKTGLSVDEVERELFTLHHMGKVGANLVDGQRIFQIWDHDEESKNDVA